MATRNRWNSQRFIERVPEAELESKMAIYRKDYRRFERDQRMEQAQIWNYLFRSDRELKDSIATRYSFDDVVKGRVSIVGHSKTDDQPNTPTMTELDRQFETFKNQLSAQLRVSINGRHWQPPRRLNYADLQRADYRPSPQSINAVSVSRLMDRSYVDQLHQLPDITTDHEDKADDDDRWILRDVGLPTAADTRIGFRSESSSNLIGGSQRHLERTTTTRSEKPTTADSDDASKTSSDRRKPRNQVDVNVSADSTSDGTNGQRRDESLIAIDRSSSSSSNRLGTVDKTQTGRRTTKTETLSLPPIVETTATTDETQRISSSSTGDVGGSHVMPSNQNEGRTKTDGQRLPRIVH